MEKLSNLSIKCTGLALFIAFVLCTCQTQAQSGLRDRIREHLQQRTQESQPDSAEEEEERELVRSQMGQPVGWNGAQIREIAGLKVAVWTPANQSKPAPLLIFSHGFHGTNTQSVFLMKALAQDGWIVVAPNHKDAGFKGFGKPEKSFGAVEQWDDTIYTDRKDDITRLVAALHKNPDFKAKIDWSQMALAGHSLGGYTALALGGAWPSWKLPGVKAVLALSPYCQPFLLKGDLGGMNIPVMYQGGTKDFGITPFVKKANGAYSKSSSPAYFVEFDKCGHFSWSGLNQDADLKHLIDYYSIAFLDKYVRNDAKAKPEAKLSGVTDLEIK